MTAICRSIQGRKQRKIKCTIYTRITIKNFTVSQTNVSILVVQNGRLSLTMSRWKNTETTKEITSRRSVKILIGKKACLATINVENAHFCVTMICAICTSIWAKIVCVLPAGNIRGTPKNLKICGKSHCLFPARKLQKL